MKFQRCLALLIEAFRSSSFLYSKALDFSAAGLSLLLGLCCLERDTLAATQLPESFHRLAAALMS